MKSKFLVLIALLIATQALAKDKAETIFGGEDVTHGGYGALEMKYSRLFDHNAILIGGRGGWIIDHSFSIGGGGYGLVSSPLVEGYKEDVDTNYYARAGWGGLYLQYAYKPNKVVHIIMSSLIGGGGLSYTPELDLMEEDIDGEYESSGFFIFEPGIGAEINFLKFFRMEVGASYRFIGGLNIPHSSDADFSGLSINCAFKFGKF